ncbi:MAG: transglutaminase-like domain-containing protein [Treponemataceae bacterium]|nr:transglutaminase-like domain-containing protein [Treponemataceae bacterium]
MKKYSVKFAILSILAVLYFVGCSLVTEPDTKVETPKDPVVKTGNVSVKMFIPDYYTLTKSRAIAPQTKYASLKYNTNINYDTTPPTYEWATIETFEIKEEDLSDIEGAEDVGLPGKIWKATFVLGLGTYYEGKLAIDLLDGDKNVITSGVNNEVVEIKENEKSSCSFFTVPKEISSNSGSLALNEMKFYQDNEFKAGDEILVKKATLGGAEVIRFNADGTFGEVVTSDFVVGNTFAATDKTAGSYYGIWAKKAAVDNYEIELYNNKFIVTLGYTENFDTLDTSVWSYGGDTEVAPVVPTIGAYEYAGTKAIKMPCDEGKNIENKKVVKGEDSFLERTVYLEENAVVSFTFISNANYDDGTKRTEFAFYIDGEEKKTWQGVGVFINAAFDLPKGQHTLKWISRYTLANGYFDSDMAFYLDKVSIVADEVDSVVIYPRGVQTVVAGETITYTAKAYRVDGSEITEKAVTKEFTATTEGEDSFDMEIDGKTATATVKVVSADYLTKPLVYMGNTYNGIDISTMIGSTANVNLNSSFEEIKSISKLDVSYPTGNEFSADAFFPLRLKVNNPDTYQFMMITISNGTNTEQYIYRGTGEDGEINTRIWLRWGAGDYTVKLYDYDASTLSWSYEDYDNKKNKSEDGKVIYQGDNNAVATIFKDDPAVTFTVTNTCDENGTWLYPSSVVQADDINIMNKATDLTYGLTNVTDKVKAIHDWIELNHFYDYDSFDTPNRKRQDAVAVMEYGMAVCEGYANLAAALIRNCGIEVKYISSISMNHAWNHVKVGTADEPSDWKLLDCTWDDPDKGDAPNSVYYNNFLLTDHNGGGHTDSGTQNIGRSISICRGHDGGTESIAF